MLLNKTLIIRYNPDKNSELSDFKKIFSKAINKNYSKLSIGTPVSIIGSGKISGKLKVSGELKETPVKRKLTDDELNNFLLKKKKKEKINLIMYLNLRILNYMI